MAEARQPITPTGYEKLKKEIERIKTVERPANIKAIEEARALGDLSENAEYHAAKEEQSLIAGKLARYEDLLTKVEVIDPVENAHDDIVFGATVKLVDVETEDEVTYKIVNAFEADVKAGTISFDSPIAQGLLGKTTGDEVQIKTPGGKRSFEVLSVEYK